MENARTRYAAAIQRSDLDWPEAVYEAFMQFENVHGTGQTIKETTDRITKEAGKVARRREKQAEEYQAVAYVPADEPVPGVEVASEPVKEEANLKRLVSD
jgi:hypothetical protein